VRRGAHARLQALGDHLEEQVASALWPAASSTGRRHLQLTAAACPQHGRRAQAVHLPDLLAWDTPYKNSSTRLDPWSDTSIGGYGDVLYGNASVSANNTAFRNSYNRRQNNVIQYWAPAMKHCCPE
jgi:hypothetical protein